MFRPKYEVADVIRKFAPQMDGNKMPSHHKRMLSALKRCRTGALGGHVDGCDSCGHLKVSYNSCRNRHCPKCQGLNKEMWIVQQEDMLLPVAYFHVVFTLPHELNPLCMHHPKEMYDLLFKAAWHTINTLAGDEKWLGAKTAATMVLHTWSQTLILHPHLHCIVPNGGLSKEGEWLFPKKGNGNFLFPVAAMKKLYRGFVMANLKRLIKEDRIQLSLKMQNGKSYSKWKDVLYGKEWVVYTKKPFSGVKHVVNYLARYSHRVAITNHRLTSIDDNKVGFSYKDYKDKARQRIMELEGTEFLRRFCLHILPPNYRKIRQYGFTSNATKTKSIAQARLSLKVKHDRLLNRQQCKDKALGRLFGNTLHQCPCCKNGQLKTIHTFGANKDPPLIELRKKFKRSTDIKVAL